MNWFGVADPVCERSVELHRIVRCILEQLNRVLSRRDCAEERPNEVKIYCAEKGDVQIQPKAKAANQKNLDCLCVISFVVLKSDERQRLTPGHSKAKHCASVAVRVTHVDTSAENGDYFLREMVTKRKQNVHDKVFYPHEVPVVIGWRVYDYS